MSLPVTGGRDSTELKSFLRKCNMCRSILLFLTLALSVPLHAQSGSSPRDLTFQISASSPWTSTGLNLQTGDIVTIVAVPAASVSSDNAAKRCDPAGQGDGSAKNAGLPVPEAGAGALIAKLQADASPILVGARNELHIDKPSHLFLGMNMTTSSPASWSGRIQVKVQTSGSASEATKTNQSSTQQTASRGSQLKSQLANAAQVFMSGQFGISKPAPNSRTRRRPPAQNQLLLPFTLPKPCWMQASASSSMAFPGESTTSSTTWATW